MKNILKKSICGTTAALMLMLTGCISSPSYDSMPSYSSSGIYNDSKTADPVQEFEAASIDFTSVQSELLNIISEAQSVLDTTLPGELDEPALLGRLEDELSAASADAARTLPEIAENDSEIFTQISGINAMTDECKNIALELGSIIDQVKYSQQRYKETHKSEIILCTIKSSTADCNIISIDPESGEKTTISSFKVYQRVTANATGREWYNIWSNIGVSNRAPLKGMVSSDYKFVAITRYSADTQEYHAGWYGENMVYYDVTEFTDSVKGDFEEPVQQISIGFTDDGHFVFAEIPKENSFFIGGYHTSAPEWKVYQVDVSTNKSVVKNSMKPYNGVADFQGDSWDWLEEYSEVTDWIDDDRCIINYPEKRTSYKVNRWGVRLLDKNTGETFSIIPGESRTNWSGVVSPDGKTIAFLSTAANGDASIYTVPIEGGNPIKLCDGIPISRTYSGTVPSRACHYSEAVGYNPDYAFLLDWT